MYFRLSPLAINFWHGLNFKTVISPVCNSIVLLIGFKSSLLKICNFPFLSPIQISLNPSFTVRAVASNLPPNFSLFSTFPLVTLKTVSLNKTKTVLLFFLLTLKSLGPFPFKSLISNNILALSYS